MSFIVSQKKSSQGMLLVITDSELIGKQFQENNIWLDLTAKFYQGNQMEKPDVAQLLSQARHIHLTGERAVALGIERDFVHGDRILLVQGVPHAEVIVDDKSGSPHETS